MSQILAEINRLDDDCQRMLAAGLRTPAQLETYRTARARVAKLWHERRVEIAKSRNRAPDWAFTSSAWATRRTT